jgi:hypothetical protein
MITDSKTKAGIREIPLHPELVAPVERLKRDATECLKVSLLTS